MEGRGFLNGTFSRKGCACVEILLALLMVSCLPLVCSWAFGDEHKAIRRNAVGEPSIAQETRLGDLYAVVVGVSRYANPRVPALKFADKDARDVAEFLKSQDKLFRRIHVTLLLNEQATSTEVKKHLVYELRRAGKDDTVVLFLSGHGADDPKIPGEFFFITHDGDPDYLEATSVNLTEMKFMRRLESRRAVLIADTCHSGGFSMHGVKATEASLRRFMNQFRESEGKVILTSCRPDEVSMEKSGMSNSVFTHYFLEALRGKADTNNDGVVTLREAYEFIYEKAKDETAGVQHPQWDGRIVGAFPLSLARETSHLGGQFQIKPQASGVLVRLPRLDSNQGNRDPILIPPAPDEPSQFLTLAREIVGGVADDKELEVVYGDDDLMKKLRFDALQGSSESQFLLGLVHDDVVPLKLINFQMAAHWYEKAAQQGNPFSQYNLAKLYEGGKGVRNDSEMAADLYLKSLASFRRSAESGDVLSLLMLARMYEQGKAVQKNVVYSKKLYSQAVEWLRRQSQTGNLKADIYLAALYFRGYAVERDYVKGTELYRHSAEGGDAQAQYYFGRLHCRIGVFGQSVNLPEFSDSKGLEWLTKSSQQGHIASRNTLKRLIKGKSRTLLPGFEWPYE